MKTGLTGSAYGGRQGSTTVRHTYVIATTAQASGIVLGSLAGIPFPTIQASTTFPAILEASICVTAADGGTTPTISFGVTSTATEIISGASTATAATGGTFLPASNAVGKRYLTSDTQIYYKTGGTPDGAGSVTFILDVTTVNTTTQQ